MTKVTVSSITARGIEPQFYATFKHGVLADDYINMWKGIAAKTGILLRFDREVMA